MASHRYWRINCRSTNGSSFVGIAEVEMRESIGGADATGSGTASASTAFPGVPASGAFDNGGGEWASDGSALPQWLKYDFGSGNDKDIVELQLTGRNPNSQMVTSFDLQWSDDNSAWTTLFSVDDYSDWYLGQSHTFSASSGPTVGAAANQAWRINCSVNDGGTVLGVAEVEWRNGSGTDLATGGTAYASGSFDTTFLPANAFDNSTATNWATNTTSGRLSYKFTGAVTPVTLAITARSGNANQAPKNFTIEYWDGSAWQISATVTSSTGWTSLETRTFSTGAAPAATARPVVFITT